MATKIFDKETLLDLTVNFIPLGIILFFIIVFGVFAPWGVDPMGSGVMFAIMIIMFVALAILTYVAGKAIAGDEKRAEVYSQGQAFLEGATPRHGGGGGEDVTPEQRAEQTPVDTDVEEEAAEESDESEAKANEGDESESGADEGDESEARADEDGGSFSKNESSD